MDQHFDRFGIAEAIRYKDQHIPKQIDSEKAINHAIRVSPPRKPLFRKHSK